MKPWQKQIDVALKENHIHFTCKKKKKKQAEISGKIMCKIYHTTVNEEFAVTESRMKESKLQRSLACPVAF